MAIPPAVCCVFRRSSGSGERNDIRKDNNFCCGLVVCGAGHVASLCPCRFEISGLVGGVLRPQRNGYFQIHLKSAVTEKTVFRHSPGNHAERDHGQLLPILPIPENTLEWPCLDRAVFN